MANFPARTYIYSDSAVPDGWANYTSLGGKHVLGATSSEQIGTTGGAASHSHAGTNLSSVAGHNHGGSQNTTIGNGAAFQAVSGTGVSTGTTGSHTHLVTTAFSNNTSHVHTVGTTSVANNDVPHTVLMLLRKS